MTTSLRSAFGSGHSSGRSHPVWLGRRRLVLNLVRFSSSRWHFDISSRILFLFKIPVIINRYCCFLLMSMLFLPASLLLLYHDLFSSTIWAIILINLLWFFCISKPCLCWWLLLHRFFHGNYRNRLLNLLMLRCHLRAGSKFKSIALHWSHAASSSGCGILLLKKRWRNTWGGDNSVSLCYEWIAYDVKHGLELLRLGVLFHKILNA